MTSVLDKTQSESPAGDAPDRRQWAVLVAVAVAQLMVVLDTTIVNIALPSAQADLGFADSSRKWIVTGYALAFGSLLLLGGRLADLFGRRTTFIVGLVGFAAASALGGAAPDVTLLLVARVLQGVFGALLAPSALSLLTTTFAEGPARRRALGIYGSVAGVGGALGLVLGGLLTEFLNWRWCLFVNLVFAGFSLVLGWRAIPRQGRIEPRGRLDLPGAGLVTLGLFCLVYGLGLVETEGWGSGWVLSLISAGLVLITAFVAWQARSDHPLLPLRVLWDRDRAGAFVSIFAVSMGLFAVNLFLVYYLQNILRLTPLVSGLAFLPMSALILLTSNVGTAQVLPRIGPRWTLSGGLALVAAGLAWLSRLDPDGSYLVDVLGPILVVGLGLGLTFSAAISTAASGIQATDSGVASATVSAAQQIGGSIGTAVYSSLAATATAAALAVRPAATSAALVDGYSAAFAWAAVAALAGAVAAALIVRPGRPVVSDQQSSVVHV